MAETLIEGLHREMNRVRELSKIYATIPTGFIGKSMMDIEIKRAEKAIEQGDTIEMIRCFKSLQEFSDD